MRDDLYAIEQAVAWECPSHPTTTDPTVLAVVRGVELEMRRRPAHQVHEMLVALLACRLPGTTVDQDLLLDAAARISVGLPALHGSTRPGPTGR